MSDETTPHETHQDAPRIAPAEAVVDLTPDVLPPHPRQSGLSCPACGGAMLSPHLPDDHRNWDCEKCGFTLPAWVNGGKLIEAILAHADPKAILAILAII